MITVKELFQNIYNLTKNITTNLPEGMEKLFVYFENEYHNDFYCMFDTFITYRGTPHWVFQLPCCWYVHRLHKLELVTDFEKHETKLYDIGKELTPEQSHEITEIVKKNWNYLKNRYKNDDSVVDEMSKELTWHIGFEHKPKLNYWRKTFNEDCNV